MRLALAAAAAVLVLTGCSDDDSAVNASSSPSVTTVSTSPSVLSPYDQAFLLKLEAIKPELTHDASGALDLGRSLCVALMEGAVNDNFPQSAQELWRDHGIETNLSEAARTVDVAHDELCPAAPTSAP